MCVCLLSGLFLFGVHVCLFVVFVFSSVPLFPCVTSSLFQCFSSVSVSSSVLPRTPSPLPVTIQLPVCSLPVCSSLLVSQSSPLLKYGVVLHTFSHSCLLKLLQLLLPHQFIIIIIIFVSSITSLQ